MNETQEHSRHSPSVKCCGLTYSWSTDSHFSGQMKALEISCLKCGMIHFKFTSKDWSPIE